MSVELHLAFCPILGLGCLFGLAGQHGLDMLRFGLDQQLRLVAQRIAEQDAFAEQVLHESEGLGRSRTSRTSRACSQYFGNFEGVKGREMT